MYEEKNDFKSFFRRFCHHKFAVAGLVFIIVIAVLVVFLPFVVDLDPYAITPDVKEPPSAAHLMGTDELGRDLFARIVYGGRVTLAVAVFVPLLAVMIGLPLGLVAGYYRGAAEQIVLRTADIFMSFPSMILIIVIMSILEPTVIIVILVLGVVNWTSIAKLVYGNVITVRKMDYIEAARASGVSNLNIITRYVLPNSISPVWVQMAFSACFAVMTESSLSFLGAGIKPPTATWGNIIYAAQNVMILSKQPWIWLFPGICLMLTVISISFIGEGIRDALDPRLKR